MWIVSWNLFLIFFNTWTVHDGDKQYINSNSCEITVYTQRTKKIKIKGKRGKKNATLISIQTLTWCTLHEATKELHFQSFSRQR